MTKDDVVDAVATATGHAQSDVEQVLDATIQAVTEGLAAGGPVEFGDLGRFVPRAEAEHTGSNPQTHEPMQIPAQTRVLFHSAKALRDAVNAAPAE